MTHVVCLLNVETDRATFTWSEGPAAFEPYTLEGGMFSDFKQIADETREKLADLVKDYLHAPENVPQASFALAESGHELFEQIFDPGAGQLRVANEIRKWLNELRDAKSIDTMEIVMERPWALPWNVIYDEPPDREAFLSGGDSGKHWQPFWGLRYRLAGGRRVNPLRRLPLPRDPCVLMVLDPEIRDGLPEDQQQRLQEFIDSHRVEVATSKDELKQDARGQRPDLLYWLSHATPDALVLGGEEVRARDLRRLLRWETEDGTYQLGGFAFLNACQTAESGEAGSFLDTLHSVGYSGMVGTEHQTIDTFAAPLGLDFLEAFLDKQQPIGKILRELHGRVPLGLLYGAYCPPNLQLEHSEVRDSRGSVRIESVHVEGQALAALTTQLQRPPLPAEPYRSLAYYGPDDRALFAGRDGDVERFAMLLDEGATRMIVLHGESGVGKSSFLRAGVIPFLEEESVGYQFLRSREEGDQQPNAADPPLFIRATNDPFGQLAESFCRYTAGALEYPTPKGDTATVDLPNILGELLGREATPDVLAAALREDATLLGRLLATISRALPFSLIVTIDQGEEMFTLAETPADVETARLAMNMFRRAVAVEGDFKIILSLRTEYYGRLIDRLRRGLQDAGMIREYLLTDFDEEAVVEAITRPTLDEVIPYSSEVPRKKYGLYYAAGLPQEIARRVVRFSNQRRDSVLPLMQVICDQLYQQVRARDDKQITRDDLESLGGIEGGMRKHVENLIGKLLQAHPADKKPLQKLFTQLYLRQPDGSLTTALLPEEEVQRRWSGRMPYADLMRQAEAMRLVRINTLRIGGGEEGRYVSLGHDSMAKLAAAWDEELSRGARLRKMVIAIAGVSAVAAVMMVLAGLAYAAKFEAVRQRDQAEQARNDAVDTVDKYFTTVSTDRLLNEPGQQNLRKELMELARHSLNKFLETYADSADDPKLQERLARTYYNLGRLDIEVDNKYTEAIEHLIKAKEIQEQLVEAHPNYNDYREALSDSWIEIGNAAIELKDEDGVSVKKLFSDTVDGPEELVKKAYDESYRLREELCVEDPGNVKLTLKQASAKMNLGLFYADQREPTRAVEEYEKAQEIRSKQQKRLETDPSVAGDDEDQQRALSTDILLDLADGNYNLGLVRKRTDRENAINSFNEAIKGYRQFPGFLTGQIRLGYCNRNLGDLSKPQGDNLDPHDYDQAIEHYIDSEEQLSKIVAQNPALDELQKQCADVHWLLAGIYSKRFDAQPADDDKARKADLDEEIAAYDAARRRYEQLVFEKSTLVKEDALGKLFSLLGGSYSRRSKLQDDDKECDEDIRSAISAYETAKREFEKLVDKESDLVKEDALKDDEEREAMRAAIEDLQMRIGTLQMEIEALEQELQESKQSSAGTPSMLSVVWVVNPSSCYKPSNHVLEIH